MEKPDMSNMRQRILEQVTKRNPAPQQCDDCGNIDEVRPYGPNKSCVCPDCAAKDPHGTMTRMFMDIKNMSEEEASSHATRFLIIYPNAFDRDHPDQFKRND